VDEQTNGPAHPADCACGTCDPRGGQPAPGARRGISAVKVHARGEDFRIVQVVGNLFVCSRANGNCCCGWGEKGRWVFENEHWAAEWERRRIRNRLHLTFTGCLGPCAVGNSAMLQIHGRSVWFKDLNGPEYAGLVFDYAQAMLAAGRVLPPPAELADHVYERYLPPPDDRYVPFVVGAGDADGLERLDPVCLMDVDPATARWKTEYGGRTIYFCAPGCKKAFLAEPEAYLATVAGGT
jgi:YHS domain-containing protein